MYLYIIVSLYLSCVLALTANILPQDRYYNYIIVENNSNETVVVFLYEIEEKTYGSPKVHINGSDITLVPYTVGALQLLQKPNFNKDYPWNDILNSKFIKVVFPDAIEKYYPATWLNLGWNKLDFQIQDNRELEYIDQVKYQDYQDYQDDLYDISEQELELEQLWLQMENDVRDGKNIDELFIQFAAKLGLSEEDARDIIKRKGNF